MPTSRRQQVLEAIQGRLTAITVADGFQTDLGGHVYLGELPGLGEDDEDEAIGFTPGDEAPQWSVHGKAFQIRLPLLIRALAKVTLDEPYQALEAAVADIKKAVELDDRFLGGLLDWPLERAEPTVRTVPREPGDLSVAIEVAYIAKYKEGWGLA